MRIDPRVETYIQRGNLAFSAEQPIILTDIGSETFEFAMYCPLTSNYEVITLDFFGYYSTSYSIEIPYLKIELIFDYLLPLIRCLKALMNDKRTWIICQMLTRLNFRLRRELTAQYFEDQYEREIIKSFIRSSKRQEGEKLKQRIEICERYLKYNPPNIEFVFFADILDEKGRKKRTHIYLDLRLSNDKSKAIIDIKTSKFLSISPTKEWIIKLDNHDVSELVQVLQEFSSLEANE